MFGTGLVFQKYPPQDMVGIIICQGTFSPQFILPQLLQLFLEFGMVYPANEIGTKQSLGSKFLHQAPI